MLRDESEPIGFLDLYLEYTHETECPLEFNIWCGLFGISVALGRRTWVDLGVKQIFPNLYVILVASSGVQRKSTAINLIEEILYRVEPKPNLLSQKATPEALIAALQQTTAIGTVIITSCTGYALVDEFKNFVNRKSYEAGIGDLLTALYDGKAEWSYSTMARGKTLLKEPLLGILGGSTVEFLRQAIPEEAIGTGVTSRIIFVSTDEIAPDQPAPKTDETRKKQLVEMLQKISLLKGVFNFDRDAGSLYWKLYGPWRRGNDFARNPYLAGYHSRRWDHVLKICMLLSASRRTTQLITLKDFKDALEIIERMESKLPQIMELVISTDQGNLIRWVYELIKGGMTTEVQLLRSVSTKINRRELDLVLETLKASGRITSDVKGGTIFWRVIEGK